MWCKSFACLVGELVGGSGRDELCHLLFGLGRESLVGPGRVERGHGLLADVAAADEPFVSLKTAGMSSVGLRARGCSSLVVASRKLRSLSALGGARGRVAAAPASQIVCGPQAARRMEELAGAGSAPPVALALNGCCRESTCHAAIRILRATAALAGLDLPCRFLVSV